MLQAVRSNTIKGRPVVRTGGPKKLENKAIVATRKVLRAADLREYQVRMVQFLMVRKYAALLVDMGLGKTISVLTAIAQLLRKKKIENVLIVAPVRVLYGVWRQEATQWAHTKFLQFSIVHGTEKQRIAALDTPAHIYLTSPDSLSWLRRFYGRHSWPFDMLVVDESSMFKNTGTTRFKSIRGALRHFARRVIMTGTPTPNSLLELWPQMFMVDMGFSLGTTFTTYKANNFHRGGYKGYKYIPNEGAREKITRAISPRVVSLKTEDHLELPKRMNVPVWVDLTGKARERYEEMEQELFLEFAEGEVESLNEASIRNRCSQIANGAIYVLDEQERKTWVPIHNLKLDAVDEIVSELQGEPPIIAYRFGHDLQRLRLRYPDYTVIGKGSNPRQISDVEREWNKGNLPGILIHPASGGHGLNLQYGGRHFIWVGLTDSLEYYMQLVKRLHRSGVKGQVMNYMVLARDTVDEVMLSNISDKHRNQKRTREILHDYWQRNKHKYDV